MLHHMTVRPGDRVLLTTAACINKLATVVQAEGLNAWVELDARPPGCPPLVAATWEVVPLGIEAPARPDVVMPPRVASRVPRRRRPR